VIVYPISNSQKTD